MQHNIAHVVASACKVHYVPFFASKRWKAQDATLSIREKFENLDRAAVGALGKFSYLEHKEGRDKVAFWL